MSWLIKKFINYKYKELNMLSLTLEAGKVQGTVLPAGETTPIEFTGEYEMLNGKLQITNVATDRQWLTVLAKEYVVGTELDLPIGASVIL